MIAITSISPNHKNFERQKVAVESWIDAGYKVVSLNCNEEIKQLKGFIGVKFIPTFRHTKSIFKRPHITASALIDYLREQNEEFNLILNSDIIINGDTEKLKTLSNDGVIIMNRLDFNNSIDEVNIKYFEGGFDGFFINKKFLHIFPQTILSMGQCFWDYWIPYNVIEAGERLYKFNEPYLYHQKHNTQYSSEDWKKTGEIFRSEVGLMAFNRVEQLSDYTFKKIKLSLQ